MGCWGCGGGGGGGGGGGWLARQGGWDQGGVGVRTARQGGVRTARQGGMGCWGRTPL